jgi:alkylation response protein AidB-like acyl-CoA dehydrogenase
MVTSEQLEIRSLARQFASGEIRPYSATWDASRELDESAFRKLAELGFLGMRVPEFSGGLELELSTYLVALEQLSWGDAAVGLSVAIHNGPVTELIARHGSEEQRAHFLPQMASGESLGAFALSEPEAGSDARAVTTEAERIDGGWHLRGTKRWVTNGERAGLVIVFARTGEDTLGAFLVDPSAAGYSVTGRERTMGLRASETVSIELDLTVPDDRVLGDPARGYVYALEALEVGRLGVAAQAVGIAQAAFEHACRYAVERKQFGKSLSAFGAIQAKLADMATGVAAARALILEVAGRRDALDAGQEDPAPEGSPSIAAAAAMAKLIASETAMNVADEAVQIFGGYGYMRDYPVEKLMRDAKGTEIYEGTNEVLRYLIARDAVRTPERD